VTPAHHLDHSTILAYAAGTLDQSLALVVASHLSWCPQCRAAVRAAEALGGELMEDLVPATVSDACRSRTMALIDGATLHRFPAAQAGEAALPGPLARMLPVADLVALPWKTKAPGVAVYDVKLSPDARGQAKLLRIAPGRAVPEHGHGGEEVTLILRGAYRDHMGRFQRGDVADLDEDVEHKPIAEPGEDCICLVAIEKPTRFKSWTARLMQPLVGI
jgi:putative transcriptional regulator